MRIALAQLNPVIGDFRGNAARILEAWKQARERGADLVLTPELAIPGYPPRDLLEHKGFVDKNLERLQELAACTRDGPGLVTGFIDRNRSAEGNALHNAAALIDRGEVVSIHHKSLLPTYDIFDEARHFEPAREVRCALFRGRRIALTICEDVWAEDYWEPGRRYGRNPLADLLSGAPSLVVNISASPWNLGKHAVRETLLARHARAANLRIVFVNQVGGQDDLVFDGASLVVARNGDVIARGREFEEDLLFFDEDDRCGDVAKPHAGGEVARIHAALVLGIRDYFRKAGGFKKAVVGLSGGIDSAVTACLAAAALGPENVLGVRMPGRYSSPGSLDDAEALARNLGIALETVSIEPMFEAYLGALAPVFGGRAPNEAEENIQARIRGAILMAISNKLGHLVLSTGNKSELGVGYCTLYGDMSGGLAVIADVPKTTIYALARWINERGERAVIPEACLVKAPSAELRPNQTDQDSLPPYDVLDRVLEAYIEEKKAAREIVASGVPEDTVRRVVHLVEVSEYKRRQAAPGFRVTRKAFGPGRRVPIARWLE